MKCPISETQEPAVETFNTPTQMDPNATEPIDTNEIHYSYTMEDIMKMVQETEGEEVHAAKPYGVGIDTASKFIDVTVFVIADQKCMSYYRRFATDWNSINMAKEWAVAIVETYSNPHFDLHDSEGNVDKLWHYNIESTANYHKPVIYAWNGMPSIINPSIAGATKKKTDKLDSKLLALQDMTGVWRESFIPSLEIEAVRAIYNEYTFSTRMLTRISNRINSKLLQFGFNVSISGSVTGNPDVKAVVMNLISDNPSPCNNLCTNELPVTVREVLRKMYDEYDYYSKAADNYMKTLINTVTEMNWETGDGVLRGDKMLEILCTAPGIGQTTAILWLIQIITPRRFHSARAVAAYCGTDPSLKISADKVTSTKKRGGNVHLHSALCACGAILIRNKSEHFGRWGANILARSGKWKKATNAVARKLSTALYYMQTNGETFSYEKYSMCREIKVIDIPITEFSDMTPGFKRYVKILDSMDIHTTQQMVDAYNLCLFNSIKGIGQRFFDIIKDFIINQKTFVQFYNEHHLDNKGAIFDE